MIYIICRGIVWIINKVGFRFTISGKENIPKEGNVLICPNHVSIYDPCVIATMTSRRIHYMAKAELFENPLLGWLLKKVYAFPVNRGKVSIDTLKNALKILRNKEILGIFPEGRRVKAGEHVDPAGGFVIFAIKTKSPIIPVHIQGEYKFRGKIKITVGEPIYLSEFYGKKISEDEINALGNKIMNRIFELN